LDKRRVTCSIQNKKNMSSREHVSPAEKGNRVHSNCRNGPWTASRIVNLSGCLFSRPRPSLHLPLHLCLQAVHLGNQELKNLSTNLSTQSCGRLWPIRERKKVSWEWEKKPCRPRLHITRYCVVGCLQKVGLRRQSANIWLGSGTASISYPVRFHIRNEIVLRLPIVSFGTYTLRLTACSDSSWNQAISGSYHLSLCQLAHAAPSFPHSDKYHSSSASDSGGLGNWETET
jgi:hypothetical protein